MKKVTAAADVGPSTRDAQIAICKVFGLTHAQTAAAVSTTDSPAGITEQTVSKRIKVNKEWIESLVEWAFRVRRESAATDAVYADVNATSLRATMEKKLPKAWSILEQAIDEGNLEMAIYVIEQVVGKANQRHSVHGTVSIEHTWRGREELMAEEHDMVESENMMKLLPGDIGEVLEVKEAELVGSE